MTIYIDVVILENLIMNYIIIYATAIILKLKIRWISIFISSLIGATYAIISYLSNLEIYSSLVLKIILSIVMIYIAFRPQNAKKMWKQLVFFYLTSFVFGGVAFALIYVIRPQDIIMKDGLFMGTYPLKTVFLGGILGFIFIIVSFKMIKTKISKKDMYCQIIIYLNSKQIEVRSMIDTGNFLKEPITGVPVIVVEHTLFYEIIPKEILNNLENILGGDFEKVSKEVQKEYMPKLKVIPFSSLGKQNGMLLGIKTEKVEIKKEEEIITKKDVIIGLYNKSLTKRGEYRALIGIELLD